MTYTLSEINTVAARLLPLLSQNVITISGPMGAGKTTLIKALVKALGIVEPVSSPTFSLVNTYENQEHTVYHFDCYRIESITEAYDFGMEEYLASGHWCFIEWASQVSEILPPKHIKIDIEIVNSNTRRLTINT